jgi:uncharacterized protein involved in exopolysaccharide biosynthesis
MGSTQVKVKFINRVSGKLLWGQNEANQVDFESGKEVALPFARLIITIKDYEIIKRETDAVKGISYFIVINNPDQLTNSVSSRLTVNPLNLGAKTIRVSFNDKNRLKSKEIVSEIIEEFKRFSVEKKKQSSQQILNFLNQQIASVYEKQKQYEVEIQRFKRENNIADLDQYSGVFIERMNSLDENMISLEIQIALLQEIKAQIDQAGDKIDVYELLPILAGNESQTGIASLIENLNQLLIEKQKLLYSTRAESAPINEKDYQIEVQKKLIIKSITALLGKLNERLSNLKERIRKTEDEYFNVPEQEIELVKLKRNYDINERFYTMLIEKKTEYSISQQGFVSNLNVLNPPRIPRSPISPDKKLIFASFSGVGIILSLLLVIIKYLLHNKITTIAEIARFLPKKVSLIGMIPKYKKDIPVSQLIVNWFLLHEKPQQ